MGIKGLKRHKVERQTVPSSACVSEKAAAFEAEYEPDAGLETRARIDSRLTNVGSAFYAIITGHRQRILLEVNHEQDRHLLRLLDA